MFVCLYFCLFACVSFCFLACSLACLDPRSLGLVWFQLGKLPCFRSGYDCWSNFKKMNRNFHTMSIPRNTFSDHFRLRCLWGFLQNSSRTDTMDVCQIQAKGYEEKVVRAIGYVHCAKSHVPFGPNCHNGRLPNSSQRVRGKCCSGQRVRAICKKSRNLCPQLRQWAFAQFKPKLTGLFWLKPKSPR